MPEAKPLFLVSKFKQASNHCEKVVKTVKLAYTNKTKKSPFFRNFSLTTFGGITKGVLSEGKSAVPSLFNDLEVLYSESEKTKLFTESFKRMLILIN